MFVYKFSAKNQKGMVVKGEIEADNDRLFKRKIHEKDLYCMTFNRRKKMKAVQFQKISYKKLAILIRQLSIMFHSGIPMNECIQLLSVQMDSGFLKKQLNQILRHTQEGNTLSASLKKQGQVFPILFIHMIECGEESGTLESMLNHMATYYEDQSNTQKELQSAMAYPVLLICLAIGVIGVLLVTVVPTIASSFQMYGELPTATKRLIAFSHLLQDGSWMIMLIFLLLGLAYIVGTRIEMLRLYGDKLCLKIPIIGHFLRVQQSNQVAYGLAVLYSAGVPIVTAIGMIKDTLSNTYMKVQLSHVKEKLEKGSKLARSMEETGIFPKMLVQMVAIGEETGKLEEILYKVVFYYRDEISIATKKVIKLIEPTMIVMLGGIVGWIVLAMIQPMYDVMGTIS